MFAFAAVYSAGLVFLGFSLVSLAPLAAVVPGAAAALILGGAGLVLAGGLGVSACIIQATR